MVSMKALTVQQPWAWAIIYGDKNIENRTQAWTYRGPLAIHAGARLSQRGMDSPLIGAAARRLGYHSHAPELLTAAILGVVDLVDVHHAEPEPDCNCMVPFLEGAGNHSPGCAVFKGCCESPWAEREYVEHGGRTRRQITHLVCANPRPLPEPIPWRGALGLWTPPADVLELLQAVSA